MQEGNESKMLTVNTSVIDLANQMSKFNLHNLTEFTTSYDDFEED